MEPIMRLRNKVAVITGGGKGIGKSISLAFASEGACVVIAARDLGKLLDTAKEIEAKGGRVKAIQTDVTDESQVERLVTDSINEFGQIDVLVNNSGIGGPIARLVDITLEDWNRVLAVDLTGSMLCAREVLKHMIPRKKGSIINIGAEGGRVGFGKGGYFMRGPYCCAKMGIIGLTETLSVEVGEYNIRVNTISPAAVKGERMNKLLKEREKATGVSFDKLMSEKFVNYSLGRPAEESEVAAATVFLASDESSGITGQVLVINCGHHIV